MQEGLSSIPANHNLYTVYTPVIAAGSKGEERVFKVIFVHTGVQDQPVIRETASENKGASEMGQQARMLAATPNNLTSIPGTSLTDGEN